ncbi:MAG: recombinase family protein [Erysipelotrichaceae bacterium]|nr:recombinase family protein [Erysipelotrichaceae bacterium]
MAKVRVIPAIKNEVSVEQDDKKRVCAYCRVSTDMNQRDSFDNQVKYYEDKIKNEPTWKLVKVYSDFAVSGTSFEGRTGFNEMIEDAMNGKIDIILTKSISRFTRNVVDLLQTISELQKRNVVIHFEEEGFTSSDTGFNMGLQIRAILAENEVRSTSDHVKRGIMMKASQGIPSGMLECYGYVADGKKLLVDEKKSKVVRFIYDQYLDGDGADTIAKMLNEKKVPSPKGGLWNSSSVRGILMNEKYTGKIIIGKTYSNDPITDKRRRKNKGEKEMFIMEDYHEAIISQEDYDTVQQIMKRRGRARSLANTTTSENYGHMYPLSGKCKCGFCGSTAFRRTIHSSTIYQKVKWGCTAANKKGKAYCPDSKNVDEEVIQSAFVQAYNELVGTQKETLEKLLVRAHKQLINNDSESRLKTVEKELSKFKRQKDNLINLRLDELIDLDTYKSKMTELDGKISKLEDEFLKYQKLTQNDMAVSERLKRFKECLNAEEPLQSFDSAVWDSIVEECILGGKNEDGTVDPYRLTFIFKTGDISRKKAGKKRRSLSDKNTDRNVSLSNNKDMWRQWCY